MTTTLLPFAVSNAASGRAQLRSATHRGARGMSPNVFLVVSGLWPILAISGLLTLAWPASGQDRDLVGVLSGKVHPLSVTLKELNSEWRRVVIPASSTVRDNLSVNVSGNPTGSTSQNNIMGALTGSRVYLTKGQTAAAGGRTYLVAYHLPGSSFDVGVLLQALATKKPPTTTTLTAESAIPLCLLDLGSIGSLEDVRPFDLQTEISESESAARTVAELMKAQSNSAPAGQPSPPKAESGKAKEQ